MPQGLSYLNILNSILYAGQPEIQEMEVLTTTQFCPGRLVEYDTLEYQCRAGQNTSAIILGIADVPSDKKLTDYFTASAGGAVTEAFTAGDQIRVLRGDIVVKVVAKSGSTIVVGTRLIPAASGMVTQGATAGQCVGYSLEDATTRLSTKCDWILMKMTI